ncbi:MAG: hypothetical protein MJZ20_04075 [Bacteroidaceae bacterium]|nr:hypothetical protein [Bacteroidaceae bacterium]
MKYIWTIFFLFPFLLVSANDGVYYTSGSFLVPIQETDISVSKEILTIKLCKDGQANVDVYYEFECPKRDKKLLMAFEADAPYNVGANFNRSGKHPFIQNFTVTMNGKPLKYSNSVVARTYNQKTLHYETDFHPLDLTEWNGAGEELPDDERHDDDELYNAKLDSAISFAYAYFFDANFQKGRNTAHHTYTYTMSKQIYEDFYVPYWLTPAVRWANHQIDEFTLRIIDEYGQGFCMDDTLFLSAPFKAINGRCWQLDHVMGYDKEPTSRHILFASEYSTLEWHAKDFRPTSNIFIYSSRSEIVKRNLSHHLDSMFVVVDAKGKEQGRYVGTCGDQYLIEAQDYTLTPKDDNKLILYRVEDGKGWLEIDDSYTGVNIREHPSANSSIITTIYRKEGELPKAYPCLGKVRDKDSNSWKLWFRIKVGDKIGYVNESLMRWDAINTY